MAPTRVSVLLGNGDGTFQPQVTYAVGSDPDALVAGDFTGDGRTDLAVANCRRQQRVGAAGQRRRHVHRSRTVRHTPQATPLVADVTGDGTDDVLVVDGAGDIL